MILIFLVNIIIIIIILVTICSYVIYGFYLLIEIVPCFQYCIACFLYKEIQIAIRDSREITVL